MALRQDGDWYVGDAAEDLVEFLRIAGADGYDVHDVRHSACQLCGGDVFGIEGSTEDSTVVRRTCRACGHQQYIGDSGEYWDEDLAYISVCVCEVESGEARDDFNVAVGYSLYSDEFGGIRSMAAATRCVACGKIATFAEWMVRTGDMSLLDRA